MTAKVNSYLRYILLRVYLRTLELRVNTMEKEKVSQLNTLFEKMLSNKLDTKESVQLNYLYNEFIEEDRGVQEFQRNTNNGSGTYN